MRKKLLFLLLALSLCLSLHVTALAHPGNTSDDDGGHIDNSTGEYHYHHGYPAHSHYDMDGDGDIDCPYDFIDKTGQNSSLTNTSSSDDPSGTHRTNFSSSNRSGSGESRSVMSTGDAGILLLIACAGYGVLRLFNKKPKETYRPSSKSAADLYRVPLGTSSLQRESKPPIPPDPPIPGMPDDTTLGLTGLPREKNCNGTAPWGDKYTVWYSKNGSKYHTFWCEWRSDIPVNVVNIDREPCRVCRPKLPDLEWYYKYKSTISAVNDSASAPSDEGAVSEAD